MTREVMGAGGARMAARPAPPYLKGRIGRTRMADVRRDDAAKPGERGALPAGAPADAANEHDALDARLDAALSDTFPASDPVALTMRKQRSKARSNDPGPA